eukprot:UN34444
MYKSKAIGRDTTQILYKIQAELIQNLKQKAKHNKHEPLRCIFLLNNIHYLVVKIQQSTLGPAMQRFIEDCKRSIVHQRGTYSKTTWKATREALTLDNAPLYPRPKPMGQKVDRKDISSSVRKQIKNRCVQFFSKMDSEYNKQKQYTIPDQNLKMRDR